MTNLTSIVAVLQIVIGIVAVIFPIGIDSTIASGLIALGLSTLGISQKFANQTAGVKGVW